MLSQNRILVGKITLLISLLSSILFISLLFMEHDAPGHIPSIAKWVALGVAVAARAIAAWAVPRRKP